jgi:hypothetical protein
MELIELTKHIKEEENVIWCLKSKVIFKIYENCSYCVYKEYCDIRDGRRRVSKGCKDREFVRVNDKEG